MNQTRLATGVPGLDERLGGGLLPGSMTAIVGATGIGKTQLGVQFARAGLEHEQNAGMIFDMTARGDSQSHKEYAERIFDWQLNETPADRSIDLNTLFDGKANIGDYLHVFDYRGMRVNRRDLDADQWREWQVELNAKLRTTIAFLYQGFVSGKRRLVVDGVEPVDRAGESIQNNLFEYIYHQVLRKEPAWVARDLFRERYRANADKIEAANYDERSIGCLLLITSKELMLDDLIAQGVGEGDALANANTLIYMGKVKEGNRFGRALYIAKHRGSACSDEIIPYTIDDQGVKI